MCIQMQRWLLTSNKKGTLVCSISAVFKNCIKQNDRQHWACSGSGQQHLQRADHCVSSSGDRKRSWVSAVFKTDWLSIIIFLISKKQLVTAEWSWFIKRLCSSVFQFLDFFSSLIILFFWWNHIKQHSLHVFTATWRLIHTATRKPKGLESNALMYMLYF